jgi:uncharacterized protein YodC (DUF2158 family)
MSNKPKIDDGGPAFPVSQFSTEHGMTLRDWFAGMALQGILAHPGIEPDDANRNGSSELAYEFADAMLKARTQ